jgi:CelD/BcsL family acetyltransferase involved in cellulose biosynthesis
VLKEDSQWTVIEVNAIPEGGSFESIMRCAERDGYLVSRWPTLLSPYLKLPTSPSDPFSNCPQHYKKDRRRLEKRFERIQAFGEPVFEVHTRFSEALFNEFLEMESSGWKGHAGGAIKCSPVLVDFYRELMSSAAREGHFRMSSLRVGAKTIAMELGFVVDGHCVSPKTAYDEAFSSGSPGQQLARLVIDDLVRQGISKYDLLGPRSRHKAIWAGDIRPHANCYIFRPSLTGKTYHYIIDKVGPRVKRAKYARYGDPQQL